MSARDDLADLIETLEFGDYRFGGTLAYEQADEILSTYAHELAESARIKFGVAEGEPCPAPSGYVNPKTVIDFIDPKVDE